MKTRFAEKSFKRWALILLSAAALLILGVGFFTYPVGTATPKSAVVKQDLDSLFKELGIYRTPTAAEHTIEMFLPDLSAKTIRLSDYRGRIVFLNFWTTWCPSCREEMPAMERLHKKFKDQDFVMIAVNLRESADRVQTFSKKYNLSFTTLLDTSGDVGTRFGVRSLPTTFILDKSGRFLGVAIGPRDWDSEKSFRLFQLLISSDQVPPTYQKRKSGLISSH